MRLSSDIIIYELGKAFPLTWAVSRHKDMELDLPLHYSPGSPPEDGRVYVITDHLPETDANAMLILCGEAEFPADAAGGMSAARLEPPQSADAVMNALLSVYRKYSSWDESLKAVLFSGESPFEALKASSAVLENPISVSDLDLKPLMRVDYSETGNEIFFTDADFTFDIMLSIYKNVKDDWEIHKDNRRSYYTTALFEDEGHNYLVIKLYNGHTPVGILSVEENRPIRAFDHVLLEHLAKYVEQILPRSTNFISSQLHSLLHNILAGETVDSDILLTHARMLGLEDSDSYRCMAISGENGGAGAAELSQNLFSGLSSYIPGLISLEFGGHFVALLNETVLLREQADYLKTIERFLSALARQAALSDSFSDLSKLRYYFTEAREALALGARKGDRRPVLTFREYCADYVIRACRGELEPEMIYSPGFLRLVECDTGASISHIETLDIYLQESLNASRAAKRLFIQRNSFLYRLERMQALLGEDLGNPHTRLQLQIYISIYKALQSEPF